MKTHALVFLAVSCLIAALGGCGSSARDAAPPEAIGSWQQERLIEGPAAASLVNAMHPTSVAPVTSWVGYYGGGIGITVYASRFADAAQAGSMLEAMKTALGGEKSGFTAPQPQVLAAQSGFRTSGMNKEHFFYVRGAWLIWIEGKATDLEMTVRAVRWVRPA